jgi:predicted PurR-regulated permease PerM
MRVDQGAPVGLYPSTRSTPGETADARPTAIPWRRYYAAVFAVFSVVVATFLVVELRRVLAWLVVAGFFAVVLAPAVELVERRMHVRRGLAIGVVVTLTTVVAVGVIVAIAVPLVRQASNLASNFSDYVNEAQQGRGPLGGLVRRFHLDQWAQDHQADIQNFTNQLGSNSLRLLRTAGNVAISILTIYVLTVLILLQGRRLVDGALGMIPSRRREQVRMTGAECGRAVSGYVTGNLIISVIAGTASYVCFWVAGIPFKEVLALWVGFADLIPLVGATLGAAPAVLVAFLHSIPAGIGVLAFFVVYQQFENHVLQVTIMARTVRLNPLAVLVSVLVGVELFGFLGALLAIPAGGALQVVGREMWHLRHGGRLDVVEHDPSYRRPPRRASPEQADPAAFDPDGLTSLAVKEHFDIGDRGGARMSEKTGPSTAWKESSKTSRARPKRWPAR